MTPFRLAVVAFVLSIVSLTVAIGNAFDWSLGIAIGIGSLVGITFGGVVFLHWGGDRRFLVWLRWNVVCWRGRRCADAIANVVTAPGDPAFVVEYVCGGCLTRYRWDSLSRERAKAPR